MVRRTLLLGATAVVAGALTPAAALARPEAPTGTYDAVIFGATPSGIVAAIRLAREGHSVLLVSAFDHIGGMLTNGVSMMDTLFEGRRAPLYDELLDRLRTFYADRDGRGSATAAFTGFAVPNDFTKRPRFEAGVMHTLLTAWVAAEPKIALVLGYHVLAVRRTGAKIESVRFASFGNGPAMTAAAPVFMDGSYEGDLLAAAGVEYAVGRESRAEFGEPHAGEIYVRQTPSKAAPAPEDALNLLSPGALVQATRAGSTGAGDKAVQAYNMRFVLSTDPANRRRVERPANYDRAIYVALAQRYGAAKLAVDAIPLMNGKVNGPGFGDYLGHSWAYAEASWPERRRIVQEHVAYGLGLLYFLQNDDTVPPDVKGKTAEYGLARDEFRDNDNVPYEVYVREARRMRGRHVFTEHDGRMAPGIGRTPVHADALAVAEWFMDSHGCSTKQNADGLQDGFILLSQATRPSQVPLRSLLPKEADNLVVLVCMSATHVGLGTLRVEPTLMHIAESAAWAAVLALKTNVAVGRVPVADLQRALVEHGVMITYFADFDMAAAQPWVRAVQYFGARGFFPDYHARADRPLTHPEARIWIEAALADRHGSGDPMTTARRLRGSPPAEAAVPITVAAFVAELRKMAGSGRGMPPMPPELRSSEPLTRGDACRLLYAFNAAPPPVRSP